MELIKVIEIFSNVFIADFLRYFIPASVFFVVFWIMLRQRLSNRFIQIKHPASSRLWFEFKYSISTVLIFAVVGLGIVLARDHGAWHFYENIGDKGWGYFIGSIGIMLIFHDAYFYWTHRWMHHPRIFKYVHKIHHISTNPSPWAAYSFHPLEAVVQAMVLPIILLFLPVHHIAVFVFLLYMIIRNVWGHLGYELFPKGFITNRWFNWHTSTTHHSMHHQFFKCNYGLYFTWWDALMSTTHKEYQSSFKEVTSRQKPVSGKAARVAVILWGLCSALYAQSPEGQWMTFDESSGEPLAIIRISVNEEKKVMEGVIDSVIIQPYQGSSGNCVKCPGNKKDLSITGLELIWGFKKSHNQWTNGKILDPENGTVYDSKIWFHSEDQIKVRGYGGPLNLFYRTQVWKRLEGSGIEGLWAAIDERFNMVRAHIALRIHNHELRGSVINYFLLPNEGNYPICTECKGDLKDMPVVGMRIMTGFRKVGDRWTDGAIMDPGNGNTYASTFWLENDQTLVIRGYWGPFFRTQTWRRFSGPLLQSLESDHSKASLSTPGK